MATIKTKFFSGGPELFFYTDFCRTQAFHPHRPQHPSPTSLPSTGARRVTPATLSGTVQAPGDLSL
jgi:hypothetical protein